MKFWITEKSLKVNMLVHIYMGRPSKQGLLQLQFASSYSYFHLVITQVVFSAAGWVGGGSFL